MKPRESGMLLVHQTKGHSTLRGLYLVSLQWMFDEGDIQQLFFSLVIFIAIKTTTKKLVRAWWWKYRYQATIAMSSTYLPLALKVLCVLLQSHSVPDSVFSVHGHFVPESLLF